MLRPLIGGPDMAPNPPKARGDRGNPGRPSMLRPLIGGPDMAPNPPNARGDRGKPGRPSTRRPLIGGPDMADHSVLIGVDVGGTTIAAGAVTADGEVLHDENVLTHDAAAVGTLVTIERLRPRRGGGPPPRGPAPARVRGGRGCLAVYASGRGIAEAARARVAGHAESTLLLAAGGVAQRITAELVFRAAADGELVAAAVVDEACRALGAMLATIVNGLNPEVVVVTGGVAGSLAALEKQILAAAAEHAFARALAATRITIVPGDKRLTMRGAAALVLYERAAHGG